MVVIHGDTTVAYKERLTLGYEKIRTSIGTVEKERKSFKDAFVRVSTSGKGIVFKEDKPNLIDGSRESNGRK